MCQARRQHAVWEEAQGKIEEMERGEQNTKEKKFMELLRQIWQWIIDNKAWEWFFSGIGNNILSAVFTAGVALASCLFLKKKISPSPQTEDLSTCPPILRQQLLERFRKDLDSRFRSLRIDERISLDIDKELSPHEVDRSCHSLQDIFYEQEGRAPQVTDRSIIDIFHDADTGERLAILGKPGSGKTICLLQLLKHLLERAKEDKKEPLPVIFECSEWDGKDLVSWMACQLHLNYNMLNEDLAREFVQDQVILPLFDGLDELLQTKQEDFVQAFNKFQAGRSLVLCCRIDEYHRLPKKLKLNHSVTLQDIPLNKLEGYLKRLQLYSLWDFLRQSENGTEEESLLQLAQRPLFLSIMLMLEKEKSLSQDEELRSGKNAEERLWQLYLDSCLKKTMLGRIAPTALSGKRHTKKQSLHWLHCLSRQMASEDKTVLRIEELQPKFLFSYWKFEIVFGFISGMLFCFLIPMPVFHSIFGLKSGIIIGLAMWLAGGMALGGAGGIIKGLSHIRTVDNHTAKILYGSIIGFTIGVAFGLPIGLIFGISIGAFYGLTSQLIYGIGSTLLYKDNDDLTIEKVRIIGLSLENCKKSIAQIGKGLYFGFILGLFLSIPGGLFKGGDVLAMAIGFSMGSVIGLVGAVRDTEGTVPETVSPGQIFLYALQQQVILLPIFSTFSMLIFVTVINLAAWMGLAATVWFNVNLFFIISVFVVIVNLQSFGSTVILKHYILRLLLWKEGQLPFRLVRWLEFLHHRKILQRVGGSYQFIHKQLLEYLARTYSAQSKPSS